MQLSRQAFAKGIHDASKLPQNFKSLLSVNVLLQGKFNNDRFTAL